MMKKRGKNFTYPGPTQWLLPLCAVGLLFVLFSKLTGEGHSNTSNIRTQTVIDPVVQIPREGTYFYFAYASDLLNARLQKGGTASATLVTVATVPTHALDYTIYSPVWKGGVADLIPKQLFPDNPDAWGVIYQVDESERSIFDKQKGVDKADPKYERITVTATGKDGFTYHASTYSVLNTKRSSDRVAPTAQYHNCIYKGAREKHLPKSYIQWLKQIEHNGSSFKRKSVGNSCD